MSPRFTRLIAGFSLAAIAPAVIITTTAHAATRAATAPSPSNVQLASAISPVAAQPKTGFVAVNVATIPRDVTVIQTGGQTFLSAQGTEVARVVAPGYAAAKAALAQQQGNASLTLTGQTMTTASTASAGTSAPQDLLNVGYACLVQTWPGTNVHPCGFVISNPVAQGIFNALKVLGSAAAVAACTAALIALGDNPGQASAVCGTAVAILAGFVNLGSKCLFIITTPSYLAGQLVAVNC